MRVLIVDDECIEARFMDGDLAGLECRDLLLIHIHAKHLVAYVGQHGTLHKTDIAGTKDSNFHTR